MPYIPTGFETLPNILYVPLLHLQPVQYYEYGMYYAKQQKFELALRYLDRVSEPIVNPDHLPVKKEPVKVVLEKSLKKKIEICCKLWLFDKAREELETLRKTTAKPFKKLEGKIDAAWWAAAICQLEQEEEEESKRSKPVKNILSPEEIGKPTRWSPQSFKCGQNDKESQQRYGQNDKTSHEEQEIDPSEIEEISTNRLCIDNVDDFYESGEDEEIVYSQDKDTSDDEEDCKNAYKLFKV